MSNVAVEGRTGELGGMGREKLPTWRMVMYALGQLGWSLASYAPGNLLVYFYMPPQTGDTPIFPAFVYQGFVLGFLTIVGLAFGVSRLFDAIVDPLVAGLSDRSKMRLGKRRSFLAIGIAPFAVFSLLVFLPPAAGISVANVVWIFATIIIYYWFLTLYVTPYFAWVSELGRNPRERLFLSTLISVTYAVGFAIGSQVYVIQGALEGSGLPATAAFQITVGGFALVGFLFMLLPIVFIDEKRWGRPEINNESVFQSLRAAFRNRDFLRFTLSDLAYWLALTMAITGLVYYVTILLGLSKEYTSFLQLLLFGLSFVFYVPTNLAAQKFGKKRVLVLGFVLFMLVYLLCFFLGWYPIGAQTQGLIVTIVLAIPIAIFGIIQNAILADIAESDALETGVRRTGVFFGARTFMQKVGQMLGGLIFPSMLLLGQTPENSIGVRLTTLVAFVALVAGLLFFLAYREKRVLDVLRTHGETDEKN